MGVRYNGVSFTEIEFFRRTRFGVDFGPRGSEMPLIQLEDIVSSEIILWIWNSKEMAKESTCRSCV